MSDSELTSVPEVPLWHWRSYRLFILFFLMFAFASTSALFMNLGIALVCMVNASHVDYAQNPVDSAAYDQCPLVEHTEDLGYTVCYYQSAFINCGDVKGTLEWTSFEQSQLFSTFFYGCILSMSISGALADHFNAKFLVTLSTIVYSLLSLISPLLANLNYFAFLASCITKIVSSWCPPNERATAASIYTSGHQISSVVSVIVSAQLCSFHFLGGWPLIFYFFGICGLFFAVCYMIFVTNSPDQNRFISEKERNFLHQALVNEGLKKKHEQKHRIPWRSIVTSPIVYSIMSCEFSYQYSAAIFANFLPSFFRDVMRFDMSQNGFYTSVPFIVQIVFKIIISVIADKLKSKYKLSATFVCKTLQSVATVGAAIILGAMSLFLDCTHPTLAMILIILFGMLFSGEVAGSFTAILFIAPPFTGTLSSLTALFGAVGGIAAPTVFGLINHDGSRASYANFFYSGALVNIVAGLFFLTCGSAELQPWAIETVQPKPNGQKIHLNERKENEEAVNKKF
ncbi:Sialin [Aphelenchoides besseyi]|nr:Sialin [Aphelenchoides besseyi]